jgi:acetate kinase
MNAGTLLVLNAGSSSLKFELFATDGDPDAAPRSVVAGALRDIGRDSATFELDGSREHVGKIASAREAARFVLARLFDADRAGGAALDAKALVASGHRVVHGGERFSAPVRVTLSVFDALKSLVPLAPLHNPHALAVMEAVGERFPELPIVAVFDTAFFHELPAVAQTYAIPREWREAHAIRRYGFHGIAHQHLARTLLDRGAGPRAVTLHLGQGCSAAALLDGRPVDTSMGFTPLEGLVMGTRSGDIDAGVLVHLGRSGLQWKEIEDGLNRRSGLLGLSGLSDDVRVLLRAEADGDAGAALALESFCVRIRKYIGAYAAVLGGLDAVAFGGGIGENASAIRERILAPLGWLGIELDASANAACAGTAARVSTDASRVDVHVVPVDEEPIIAQAMLDVLRAD